LNIQDFYEVLVSCSLEDAGWNIAAWDTRPDGFCYEVDFVCDRPRSMLVLVNGSDSFFASQKKFWRNVEEPFEAAALWGSAGLVATVSFLTSTAHSQPLFLIARRFFDLAFAPDLHATYPGIDKAISRLARRISASKRDAVDEVRREIAGSVVVKQLHHDLTSFFRKAAKASPSSIVPRDKSIYRALRSGSVKVTGNSRIRKQFVALSILGRDGIVALRKHFDGHSKAITFTNHASISPEAARAVTLVSIHSMATVSKSIVGLILAELSEELVDLLTMGDVHIDEIVVDRNELLRLHPNLQEYIDGSADFEAAEKTANAALTIIKTTKTVAHLSKALLNDTRTVRSHDAHRPRNWLLEALLLLCNTSQTYVQARCSVHRLTHVVTGELALNGRTASEVAEVLFPLLPKSVPSVRELAEQLMRQKKYNLDTHSYANPIYLRALKAAEQAAPKGATIEGFPRRNSVEFPSWHNRDESGRRLRGGEIKVQLLIQDAAKSKSAVIKVISAHEGHSADKRKEMSAKGTIMRLVPARKEEIPSPPLRVRNNVWLALVLDGDWISGSAPGGSALDMLAKSGWSGIYDNGSMSSLERDLGEFFRR
jgi:hypothetical protein